jgi:hypothetical protein
MVANIADQFPTDVLRSTVGAGLLAMAALQPTWILLTEYISIPAVTATYGFALTASPFCQTPGVPAQTKGPKKSCPTIRPLAKARGTLTPALLRGPAAIRHPWPRAAIPASMPGCPLCNACVRPLGMRQVEQDQKPEQSRARADLALVGASLLAENVWTTHSFRQGASSLTTIAGKPAPTGERVPPDNEVER